MGWSSNYTQSRVPIFSQTVQIVHHYPGTAPLIALQLQLPWLGLQWPCCKGRRRAARTECRVESLVVFQKFRPWWMFTLKLKLMNLDDYFLTRLDIESSSFASFGKFFGSFRLKLFFTHPRINSGWWQLKYCLFDVYLGKMILFD